MYPSASTWGSQQSVGLRQNCYVGASALTALTFELAGISLDSVRRGFASYRDCDRDISFELLRPRSSDRMVATCITLSRHICVDTPKTTSAG